ncbi:YcaO-like family protein [Streptomyces sp. S.PNR 29]|uniref:YcaO-like family protein n=1 Tax=Streptomyces sp. S.PNR 29 TaxID=2973805 RepID=UPI0025B02F7B|nr:YcaO-like family protein [Streptomyces sp. S.PNR 29]MDN0195309.1 YcaO-like family protein [Streptomyces sp. S.PNR 29]
MKMRDHAPKFAGAGTHREVSAEETAARVWPYLRHAGITRVADITWLDRIGIPVYNAISPRSRDLISVYNGKGLRPIDAKVSAVMEAVERFAAWLPRTPAAVASYAELAKGGCAVLNPADCNTRLSAHYRDDAPVSWLSGYDLVREEPVLVPMHGTTYSDQFHEPPVYSIASTNGLASGNTVEEAVTHALCELIERDSMTLAELVTTYLEGVLRTGTSVPRQPESVTSGMRSRHPHFVMDRLPPQVEAVVARFRAAGVEVRMVDITSELGVPSVWCATVETFGPTEGPQGHGGFGTHPDVTVAMIRALTECAQSRAVDIQAMREDISTPDEEVPKHLEHVHRVNTVNASGWWWEPTDTRITAADVPSHPSEDVTEDLRLLLDRLVAGGLDRVIVVDLSPPTVPASVVRVIVPGLESWSVDHSKLGARATRLWNTAVAGLTSPAMAAVRGEG